VRERDVERLGLTSQAAKAEVLIQCQRRTVQGPASLKVINLGSSKYIMSYPSEGFALALWLFAGLKVGVLDVIILVSVHISGSGEKDAKALLGR